MVTRESFIRSMEYQSQPPPSYLTLHGTTVLLPSTWAAASMAEQEFDIASEDWVR